MATAVTPSNCLLCDDQCNSPTKLPNCGHIFCKACLMTYACIYKEDNDTVSNLKCPSCGVNNDKPRGVDTESWLDTLSAGTVIAEDKPSSSPEVECASCKSLGRSEKAVKYCLNCMECLCRLCLNICHTLKPMRHHEFIDISNACDKGNDDLNLLRKMSSLAACASHPNETIKFHCLDDDSFCCTICIVADHRKCSKVVEIEKEVVGEAYTRDMAHTKHSASNVLKFAHEAIKQLQSGIKVQNKQADDIAEHLTEIRDKIIKVLDELESKCNTTAKDLIKRETTKIQDEIRRLKSEVESFESHVTLMEKTDKNGSASHQYIAKKSCQEKLKQFEAFLDETTRKFESIKVCFKHEKLLDELLNLGINDTTKLGSVRDGPDNPIITLYAEAKLKCYIISKVEEKEVKENYTSKTTPKYSSAVFLSNNQLVLLDSRIDTGHCLLVSEAGKVLSSCDFLSCGASSENKPYCVTETQLEGVIAVSMPEQKQICFVSTTNGQLKVNDKRIQTKYKPRAICGLKNGDIAVAWNDPVAFGLIDIKKEKIDKVHFCHDKTGRSLKSFDYIAVDEDRSHVIQPCTTDRAVYCFDFNGNPKFKYTHPELNDPRCVAVDKDGNIYVCSYDLRKASIHVISPTGGASRMIKDGCPRFPLAIAFNKDGDTFAVTNNNVLNYRLITFFSVKRR